jgi:arsenate reductase-like glutaredoxin family protein
LTKPSPKTKTKSYDVITAGDITTSVSEKVSRRDISTMNFIFKKASIDPNDYHIFVTHGNSMKKAGINDNDFVFVKTLSGDERYNINSTPVLAFEIDKSTETSQKKDEPVELKLRKFISYVNGNSSPEELDKWFEELKKDREELGANKENIFNKLTVAINNYKENNSSTKEFKLLFSETGANFYSFHPIKFLYGIVEYVVDHQKIPQ